MQFTLQWWLKKEKEKYSSFLRELHIYFPWDIVQCMTRIFHTDNIMPREVISLFSIALVYPSWFIKS